MYIPTNSDTLETEFKHANVDISPKTLGPFGLEMFPGVLLMVKILMIIVTHQLESACFILPLSAKDRSLNMDNTNSAKEQKMPTRQLRPNNARIYSLPNKVNNETWVNTLLHWMAPVGKMLTRLPVKYL